MNNARAFIIAEIGVNHGNDIKLAMKLIDEAKFAGADAVKFQTFKAKNLASIKTPKAPYQLVRDASPSHKEMLEKLELSDQDHFILQNHCKKREIEFLSTAYSLHDAKFLINLGLRKIKIASADIVDTQMLEYLSHQNVVVIISTGMANRIEIESAIRIFDKSEKSPWVLHCISEYPTELDRANLGRISILGEFYSGRIGYSDHNIGTDSAIVAFGLGARIFEKHFTHDKNAIGPDHAASADIGEFRDYVRKLRNCEMMLGSKEFVRSESENLMAVTSRKSLHYKVDLKRGDSILEKNICLLRPGSGYFWDDRHQFIGKRLRIDVNKDEQLNLSQLD